MDRVLRAQGPQFAVPLLGLPAVSAPTGFVDLPDAGGSDRVEARIPVGVQIIGHRFREDLVLEAAEVLEGRFASPTPIDPVSG
jgi:amidase